MQSSTKERNFVYVHVWSASVRALASQIHTHAHTNTHIRTHTDTYIHTHTHTHTYECMSAYLKKKKEGREYRLNADT